MKNLIEYLKDKIYYIMAATILLIVVLVIISSCSGKGNSYASIENNMVNAAKKYYSARENKLPKEEGSSVKVTLGTLIDAELLKEVKDPKKKDQLCEGYVQVKKVEDNYVYIPFLTCQGNYEPEYLVDKIKKSKLDEYGNGVYEMDGEYVYRGDDVKNYISFNNQIWRIMRVNSNNETKLILNKKTEEDYSWEKSYNINKGDYVGITSDYLNTNMRKTLLKYYKTNFSDETRSLILSKTWCIGALKPGDDFNREKECSKTKDNEYIGLMNISDYGAATLDPNCSNPTQSQCNNRNYLTKNASIATWTMNTVEGNDYQMLRFIYGSVIKTEASNTYNINPVIYLSEDAIISSGDGSINNPFVIKI